VYSLNPETLLANNLAYLFKKMGFVGAASYLLPSSFMPLQLIGGWYGLQSSIAVLW
jgi:hypothetical protein